MLRSAGHSCTILNLICDVVFWVFLVGYMYIIKLYKIKRQQSAVSQSNGILSQLCAEELI